MAECHSNVKGAFRIFRHLSGVRKAVGLIGDRDQNKRASSDRLDLLLTFACRLLSATKYHSNKISEFRIPRNFGCIRKVAGLSVDRAESKRASSGSLDLLLTFFLLHAARD